MRRTIACISVLFLSGAFFVPSSLLERIQEKLEQHYRANLITKTHLFFNQPAYMPGDTIFFSGNVVFAEDLTRVPGHHVLDVRLVDYDGEHVVSNKFSVHNGSASSFLVLPNSLTPGIYTLECTASWQQHTPSFRAHYLIPVGGSLAFQNTRREWKARPEGGVLVAGVMNRIGVIGPANSHADIITKNGDIVGTVNTGPTGLGLFNILPHSGEHYRLRIGSTNADLQEVSPKGIALHFAPTGNSTGEIRLQGYPVTEFSNKKILLTLIHHSSVHGSAEILLSPAAQAKVNLPLEKLPEGIIVATIWDENENVLAERLFFNRSDGTPTISSTKSKDNYQPREKINYDLLLRDASAGGTFSIRVVSADLFGTVDGPGQSSDLLFWQDIGYGMFSRGNIDIGSVRDADLLLLMTAWMRYESKSILKNSVQQQNKVIGGQTISGHVVGSSEDYANKEVWAFLEEEGLVLSSALNPDGTFEIPLPFEIYGKVSIFYQVIENGSTNTGLQIELHTTNPDRLPRCEGVSIESSGFPYHAFNSELSQISKVYSTFTRKNSDSFNSRPALQLPSQPDAIIALDDFERFNTLEETIREVLPMMRYRKVRNKNEVRIWHDDVNRMAEGPPLFVIDGHTTGDVDYFMRIPVSEIETVSIFASKERLASFGAPGRNGIVVVKTFSNSHGNVPASNRIVYTGLQRSAAFHNISDADVANRNIPLFKSCLYWNPQVRVEKNTPYNLAFFAPDNPGRFLIQFDGVTDDGRTVSHADAIYVRHEPH